MTTNPILAAFSLAVGGVLALAAVEFVNRKPALGIGLLYAWLGVSVLFNEHPELLVKNVAGINVVVVDVLAAFLIGIAALRFLRSYAQLSRELLLPLSCFVGLLLLSYLRGLLSYGLQHSTNEFREFFYFLAALAFSLSFRPAALASRLPGLGVLGGLFLVLVAAVRLPMMHGFTLEDRVLPSYAALAMGQAFFCGWCWASQGQGSSRWRAAMFGFIVVSFLMFHRSVWVCMAGGMATLLLVDHEHRARLSRIVLLGAIVGGAVILFALGEKVAEGVRSAVTEATSSENSTFMWRIEGWVALMRPSTGWNLADLLVGRPMGSGYARILSDASVNAVEIDSGVIPHNYYLSVLLRGGAIGLAAFLWLYSSLLRRLLRAKSDPAVAPLAVLFSVLLIMQLIYYVPYSADSIQGIFLGGSIALVTSLAVRKKETAPVMLPRYVTH